MGTVRYRHRGLAQCPALAVLLLMSLTFASGIADRALPRLVAAVALTEAFGYSQIELTDRELGVGLIIEAGLARGNRPQ